MDTKLNKIDVAIRQLDAAIRFFFSKEDPVAIHTLTCAAHKLLSDLTKGSFLLNGDWMVPERKSEILKLFKLPQNFFKHADKDPSATIDFNDEVNQFFIYDSIRMYTKLKEHWTVECYIFNIWFPLKYSGIVTDPQFKEMLLMINSVSSSLDIDWNNYEHVTTLIQFAKEKFPKGISWTWKGE